jgi:hypothetical protein
VLAILPALVIGSVAVSAIWGDNGLGTRHKLKAELAEANHQLADLERDNQQRLRDLRLMDEDPLVLERLVADELAWGQLGVVLYRFNSDDDQPDK